MNLDAVQPLHDRAADGALAVAAVAASIAVSPLAEALQVVQIVAGCVAILSGLCAAAYYIKKTWFDK
jgi:uncharacterized membrane protein YhaH (DUF805 family)